MAGMVLPYFKMFAAETLSDGRFQGWDVAERGAWLTLICVQWREGAIPADLTSLAKLLHVDSSAMRSLWSSIGDRFVPHPDFPGMLASPRMEEERDEALASLNQKKRAGKLGADSRWSKAKRANSGAMAVPCEAIADPMANDSDQRSATQINAAAAEDAAAADLPRLRVVDEAGDRSAPEPTDLDRFRRGLSDSLARTAPHPVGGGKSTLDSVEAALRVIPVAEAVAFCRQRVMDDVAARRPQPRTLAAFASMLAEEVTRRKATDSRRPTRYVGVDSNGQPIPEVRQ